MRRLMIIIQALAVSASLFAQNANLNPTVQVTNTYEKELKDFERSPLKTEIPDSLYRFDLNFDYSGFEKPYKGNDEFNPFLTELDIVGRPFGGKNFRMKAGAGYTLHPQLDLAWTFPSKGRFKAGLFAHHKSYFGKYIFDREDVEDFNGLDSYTGAGFEGRADWDRVILRTALWYDGVQSHADWIPETKNRRNYNSGSAMLRLSSRDIKGESSFKFDLDVKDSFGSGRYECPDVEKLLENVLDVSLLLGYKTGGSFFGLGTDFDAVSGKYVDEGSGYGGFALTFRPQYSFTGDVIALKLGIALLVTGTDNMANSLNKDGKDEKFDAWPYLKFEWNVVPDKFIIFADADVKSAPAGERSVWGISHLPLEYDPSVVKNATAGLGFKGTLWKKMQWKFGAGYEHVRNAYVTALSSVPGGLSLPEISRIHRLRDFDFYLDVDATFGIFTLDANLCYRAFLDKADNPVLPSALTGGLRAGFDIRRRANVHIGTDFRSSRDAGDGYRMPAYMDLYAGADFRLTNKLGFFVEGRNLLCRKLQTVPLVSEKGMAITGGIVLNF